MSEIADTWTKDQTRKLIREVRKYPCLFSPLDPNFTKKERRAEKLREILQQIKVVKNNVTVEDIKKKIRTLQSQLSREKKQLENSKKSNCGADEIYEPKLWCYEELLFLRNANDSEFSCSNTNLSESLQSQQSLSEAPPFKKIKIMEENPLTVNEVVGKVNEDEGTLLAKTWAIQYNELTSNQKLLTRKIFSDVLFHGGLGNLTQNIVTNIQNILDAKSEHSIFV